MRTIDRILQDCVDQKLMTKEQRAAIIALFERTRCVDIPDEHLEAVRQLCERR